MEIKKQQMSEAGMSHAKKVLGPDQFKTNKVVAREISSHYVEGMKHMHLLTEQELQELEADKNLVLKHWDEAKKQLIEKAQLANETERILRSKLKELTATGALKNVYELLDKISGKEAKHA